MLGTGSFLPERIEPILHPLRLFLRSGEPHYRQVFPWSRRHTRYHPRTKGNAVATVHGSLLFFDIIIEAHLHTTNLRKVGGSVMLALPPGRSV